MGDWRVPLDDNGREVVRAYLADNATKGPAEQRAFNEGVMCAAFAMGAVIDGMEGENPAKAFLERAYNAATKMRLPYSQAPR